MEEIKAETEQETTREDEGIKIDDNAKQFLTFRVSEEEYGVELMTIREIKGWTTPTQLPNSPTFMKGVINLRGVVIPIFDLKHRFAMGETTPNEKNVVIIISVDEKLIGILVDAVSDILSVKDDDIKQAPQVDSKIDENFVEGLISVDDKMVVILRIESLFDAETLAKAERASAKEVIKEEIIDEAPAEEAKEETAEEIKEDEEQPEEVSANEEGSTQ